MEHTIGGETIHNIHTVNSSYRYSNPIGTYDPNLGSAASYSPSFPQTPNQSIVDESDYTNATYSNVIFVPDIERENETDSSLIDPTQSYILQSDSRLFNTFVRSCTEVETTASHFDDRIMTTELATHHHQVDSYNLQQPESETDFVSSLVNSGDTDIVGGDCAEIIMQEVNGEFYQQIQNIYVENDPTNAAVEFVPTLINEEFSDYDQHQSYYPSYEIESDLGICADDKTPSNDVVYISNDDRRNNQVQMVVNNQFNYKNEYTILEPMNRIQMQRHNEQQEMISCHQQTATNDLTTMIPVPPVPEVNTLADKEQRLLLETTMSPLLAAVNDITLRDEQFQKYLVDNSLKHNSNHETVHRPDSSQFNNINTDYIDNDFIDSSPSGPVQTICPTNDNTINQHRFQQDDQQFHNFNREQNQNDNQPIPSMGLPNYGNNLKITNIRAVSSEYVDINDMDFIGNNKNELGYEMDRHQENLLLRRSQRKPIKKKDDLMVSDKQVPSRAWATLPSSYLFIGKSIDCSEQTIFAKKEIPLRTKFGPLEGELKSYSICELNQWKNDIGRMLPLLIVDGTKILDVSNEHTSNWMRFVRLATTFTEQNLQLYECDEKLYFRSCQIISAKHELKVGYSPEYAVKYNLKLLEPEESEKSGIYEKNNPWPCFECDKRFETCDLLQNHLNVHETGDLDKSNRPRKRKTARRFRLSSRKISGPTVRYACCYCSEIFSKYSSFKRHNEFVHSIIECDTKNGDNSALINANRINISKPCFKCEICRRYFGSAERLEKHNLMHSTASTIDPKLVQCTYCPERLLTPSALAMHIKSHIYKNRLFSCLFCSERFRLSSDIMAHVKIHIENGHYTCPTCQKQFKEYVSIRKHIRTYHSNVKHTCPECGKDFKSRTKLKYHRLRHSDVREFLCSDCGKQFKRKDKLREHILAIHLKEKKCKTKKIKKAKVKSKPTNEPIAVKEENELPAATSTFFDHSWTNSTVEQKSKKFQAKVAPTDYQRFIYKCHDCLLGFKRRGMLVNHMAKRHPTISIDSVPELNLPILKAQRYYYCQYCDKVYKSSGKRKAHILKYHPGSELPQSSRQNANEHDIPGIPNPSFSETVGNVTTHPQRCQWCHKQYASKARLLQHQRKVHTEHLRESDLTEDFVQNVNNVELMPHTFIQEHQNHPYSEFGTENKLLKLSSAALEASLKDDFKFFDGPSDDVPHSYLNDSSESSTHVDVNFKVVNAECGDSSTESTADLNRLPILFDDIDYLNIKSVETISSGGYGIKKINYSQNM